MRVLVANFRSLRSVAIEFGPAELIDSVAGPARRVLRRPAIFGNMIGRLDLRQARLRPRVLSLAIVSYERFKALLCAPPQCEEVSHESVTTVAAA